MTSIRRTRVLSYLALAGMAVLGVVLFVFVAGGHPAGPKGDAGRPGRAVVIRTPAPTVTPGLPVVVVIEPTAFPTFTPTPRRPHPHFPTPSPTPRPSSPSPTATPNPSPSPSLIRVCIRRTCFL